MRQIRQIVSRCLPFPEVQLTASCWLERLGGKEQGAFQISNQAKEIAENRGSPCKPQKERFNEPSIAIPYDAKYSGFVTGKTDVRPGTLALMVLKTLERAESLHGYGIARQIEQTSADLLSVNYGTHYPAPLKLEQEGYITSKWGFSDNNRKAKFYQLTKPGRKQIGERNPGMGANDGHPRSLPESQNRMKTAFDFQHFFNVRPMGYQYLSNSKQQVKV